MAPGAGYRMTTWLYYAGDEPYPISLKMLIATIAQRGNPDTAYGKPCGCRASPGPSGRHGLLHSQPADHRTTQVVARRRQFVLFTADERTDALRRGDRPENAAVAVEAEQLIGA